MMRCSLVLFVLSLVHPLYADDSTSENKLAAAGAKVATKDPAWNPLLALSSADPRLKEKVATIQGLTQPFEIAVQISWMTDLQENSINVVPAREFVIDFLNDDRPIEREPFPGQRPSTVSDYARAVLLRMNDPSVAESLVTYLQTHERNLYLPVFQTLIDNRMGKRAFEVDAQLMRASADRKFDEPAFAKKWNTERDRRMNWRKSLDALIDLRTQIQKFESRSKEIELALGRVIRVYQELEDEQSLRTWLNAQLPSGELSDAVLYKFLHKLRLYEIPEHLFFPELKKILVANTDYLAPATRYLLVSVLKPLLPTHSPELRAFADELMLAKTSSKDFNQGVVLSYLRGTIIDTILEDVSADRGNADFILRELNENPVFASEFYSKVGLLGDEKTLNDPHFRDLLLAGLRLSAGRMYSYSSHDKISVKINSFWKAVAKFQPGLLAQATWEIFRADESSPSMQNSALSTAMDRMNLLLYRSENPGGYEADFQHALKRMTFEVDIGKPENAKYWQQYFDRIAFMDPRRVELTEDIRELDEKRRELEIERRVKTNYQRFYRSIPTLMSLLESELKADHTEGTFALNVSRIRGAIGILQLGVRKESTESLSASTQEDLKVLIRKIWRTFSDDEKSRALFTIAILCSYSDFIKEIVGE